MTRLNTVLAVFVAVAVSSAASTESFAQPNPFEAYEKRNGLAPPVDARAGASADPDESANRESLASPASDQVRAGTMGVGIRTSLNFTDASAGVDGGGDASTSSFFLRVAPSFGYFVIDRVEVALEAGLFARSIDRNEDGLSNEVGGIFEAVVRYHLPIARRFGFIGAFSLGGYVGSSERQVETIPADGLSDPVTVSESTSTGGFAMSLGAGVNYFVSEGFDLRFGLEFALLAGRESSDVLDDSFSAVSTFVGLSLGGAYRF